MISKKWKGLFVFCFCVSSVMAQYDESSNQELRKVAIAPGPNASAIGKYGDMPVSLSTGIASIAIPFYTYSAPQKGASFNVGLNYHSGGIKVEDMASNVGLGWSLNAGGMVSRTMRGRPDEDSYGYLNTSALPYYYTNGYDLTSTPSGYPSTSAGICYQNVSYGDFLSVQGVSENSLDGECDIFQFSVGNVSGKFFFKKDGSIQLVSQSNLKITYSIVSGSIDEFIIKDEKGFKYVFNQKEWSTVSSSLSGVPPTLPTYVSSWYVTKIVFPDAVNEINFTYGGSGSSLTYQGGFSDSYRLTISGTTIVASNLTQSYNDISGYVTRISQISFPDGTEVDFTYGFSRDDYYGDNALTAVTISNGTVQKTFTLSYGYFESDYCAGWAYGCTPPLGYSSNDFYKRLKLVSVQESSGSLSLPPYTFEYNSTKLPVRNSKAQDWWGFYNGQGYNGTLNGSIYVPAISQNTYGGNKTPSLTYAKAWTLEKLNYPTGGYTSFDYELNYGYESYSSTYMSVGGLRIKTITDYDSVAAVAKVSNYTYTTSSSASSGVVRVIPSHVYYWNRCYLAWSWTYEDYLNQTSQPTQSLSYFNGSPIIYSRVVVDNTISSVSNGYVIHEFTNTPAYNGPDNDFPYVQKQDLDWSQGLPLTTSYYSASNVLLKKVENEYDNYYFTPSISDGNSRNLIAGLYYWDDVNTFSEKMYGARAYYMTYGRSDLKKTTVTDYDASGSVATVTNHYYDNASIFTSTRSVQTDSKGNSITTERKFAHDFVGQSIPDQMITKNMVAVPLEVKQTNTTNSTVIGWFKNVHALFNSTTLDLSTQERYDPQSTAWDTELQVLSYDSKGNIAEIQGRNNITTSYLWNENGNYPSAEVVNAPVSAIAYSSFESSGKGNWTYSGTINTGGGATGSNSYSLSSGNITHSSLNSGITYTVSYWLYAGGWVSGISGTSVVTKNGWTLYTATVSGTTSLSIGGSGYIDELRLYPSTAQMSTVTYNPLTGATSKTNANNQITYYEYDALGRLQSIRDWDKNIVKAFDYKYKVNPTTN
nr:hypothetical protein [uncultured Sediminibacterium sp.]